MRIAGVGRSPKKSIVYLVWHRVEYEGSTLLAVCATLGAAMTYVYREYSDYPLSDPTHGSAESVTWAIDDGYPEYVCIEPEEVKS